MENIFSTLPGETIAALAAIVGLFVGAGLKLVSDRYAEKRKLAAEYRQQQIKELYGPLYCLMFRDNVLHEIYEKLIKTDKDGNEDLPENYYDEYGDPHPENLKGVKKKIWEFFRDTYFLRINKEMQELIFKNHHLLNTPDLPKSFKDFLRHEVQFQALRCLEEQKIVVTDEQVGRHVWEKTFYRDTVRMLWELKEDVEIAIGIRFWFWKLIPRKFKNKQRAKQLTR